MSLTEGEVDALTDGGIEALEKITEELLQKMDALLPGVEIANHEIISALYWSQWTHKDTREGPRMMRYAKIAGAAKGPFWDSWKREKHTWIANGFSPSKDGPEWILTQWLTKEGKVSASALNRAEQAKSEAKENILPADWLPEGVTLTSEASKFLYPYQRNPAIRLKGALLGILPPDGYEKQLLHGLNGNALDASDTGTGKTVVSLVVCAELGLKPCVIAPLAVLPSWNRAAKFLNVPLGWLINYDKIRGGKSGLGRWKEDMRGVRFEPEYMPKNPLFVFDEVQKCKSPDSKQGQILRDIATGGHKVLMLSATAHKDPTEMRNTGAALGLHDGSKHGFSSWAEGLGCYIGSYGLKFDWKAKKALEGLHRTIFPLRGQRIRVADVPDFPETMITADALDTGNTADIKNAYAEMDRKLAEAEGMNGAAKGAATLAAIMAARIASEKAKLDLFEELVKEGLEEGRSPLVFCNFREHLAILAERFKSKCIIWGTSKVRDPLDPKKWIDGKAQKADERQAIIDDFQHDRSRVVFISLAAGGAGINLHDQFNGKFPRLALISPSYSAVDLKQALGRPHRAGALTKSFQRIIFAAGTIEEEICASMRVKLASLETLNDGALQPAGLAERLKGVKLEGEANQ